MAWPDQFVTKDQLAKIIYAWMGPDYAFDLPTPTKSLHITWPLMERRAGAPVGVMVTWHAGTKSTYGKRLYRLQWQA